jgi:hypothetical protein
LDSGIHEVACMWNFFNEIDCMETDVETGGCINMVLKSVVSDLITVLGRAQ